MYLKNIISSVTQIRNYSFDLVISCISNSKIDDLLKVNIFKSLSYFFKEPDFFNNLIICYKKLAEREELLSLFEKDYSIKFYLNYLEPYVELSMLNDVLSFYANICQNGIIFIFRIMLLCIR